MHNVPRILAAAATFAVAAAALVTDASPAVASWYGARVWPNAGVNVRDCYHPPTFPSTNCNPIVAWLPKGTIVHIVCQTRGQIIEGDEVWDYVVFPGGEGLAADAWIDTGGYKWIPGVDQCS